MSEHTGEEQRDVERAGKRFTPSRNSSLKKLAAVPTSASWACRWPT